MKLSTKDWICIILVITMFLINMSVYLQLPEKMASHWSVGGQVDGWMDKFWGTYLIPIISIFMIGLFLLIPKIMVFKENFEKFKDVYDNFKIIFTGFMFILNLVVVFSNLGYDIPVGIVVAGLAAVLLFYMGHIMPKLKRNYFIGVRTPWSLADDKNWEKTQIFGGKVMKVMAVFLVLAFLFQEYFYYLFMIPIVVGILSIFWYSWNESRI